MTPIVGCQRSGTTLLMLCLDSHPCLIGVDEHKSVNFMDSTDNRLILKLPVHTISLQEYSRALFMTRCIKSIVGSMLKLYPQHLNPPMSWAKRYAWGEASRAVAVTKDQGMKSFFTNELEKYKKREGYEAAICAFTKTYLWKDYDNCHIVRYSALVDRPETTLKKVLEYLSISWDKRVLEHHKDPSHKKEFMGKTRGDRPIDDSGKKSVEHCPKHISGYIDMLIERFGDPAGGETYLC